MIENNIIFSLIVSLVNTVAFYLFTSRNKKDIVDHKQEMILLFGISLESESDCSVDIVVGDIFCF